MSDEMKTKRQKLFKILFLVVGGCALLYGSYYFFIGSHHIKTDNAYVGAEIAQISPATAGNVKAIQVTDTDLVKRGDVLVVIDDIDAQLTLATAKADHAKAQVEYDRRQQDYERRKAITKTGSVSLEELSTAENGFKAAKAILEAAKVMVEQAEVNLGRTTIYAPIDGVIAKRQVQLGQRVQPGMSLMSIVPMEDMHVDANFKEVQIRKIKNGQKAKVTSDLYGNDVIFDGEVVGVAAGTGAAFSIIPAQNATGNWIKVVQRLPVRVKLKPEQLRTHPLQVGLSMYVDVDVSGD